MTDQDNDVIEDMTVSTANATGGGLLNLKAMKIRGRLFGGFGAVCAVIAGLVGFTLWEVAGVSETNTRIVELRVPTSAASLGMVNGINATLAGLRGWMITGNPAFKKGRAASWAEIDKIRADMDKLSQTWTNAKNVEVWQGYKAILDEFREAQAKIEAIAKSPDEQPATKILVVEAAPKAQVMVAEITNIINEEARMPATAERKALLGMMADVRGTTARGLANIRAFLLTGNQKFHKRFQTMWNKNIKRFADLKGKRHLLNPAQKASFDKLDAARTAFLPLPERMFDIRGSKKWNMANYLLVTEAAPRAGKLMSILLGSKNADGNRGGGMVQNQKRLLTDDAQGAEEAIARLTSIEWFMLALGLGLGGFIAFVTARSIVNPVNSLTGAMTGLAGGDKQSETPGLERSDEMGRMAEAVEVFKQNMIDNDRLQNEQKEAEMRAAEAEKQAEEDRRQNEQRVEQEKRQAMLDLADDFEKNVGGVIQAVGSAAAQMKSSAEALSATAEETNAQSTAVAAASEQASSNVETVASATEELNSSIDEVGRQVTQSTKIAQGAVEEARKTNEEVQGLADAAQKIGEVVSLITDIASQTNLLALNATIEAAPGPDFKMPNWPANACMTFLKCPLKNPPG